MTWRSDSRIAPCLEQEILPVGQVLAGNCSKLVSVFGCFELCSSFLCAEGGLAVMASAKISQAYETAASYLPGQGSQVGPVVTEGSSISKEVSPFQASRKKLPVSVGGGAHLNCKSPSCVVD